MRTRSALRATPAFLLLLLLLAAALLAHRAPEDATRSGITGPSIPLRLVTTLACALPLLGVLTAGAARRVTAAVSLDAEGRPRGFTLAYGSETTALEPGRTWTQIDHFKWVTRGIIEPPQSYVAHADGSIDLNGETYRPGEPGHADALTEQLNKHHTTEAPARPKPAAPRADAGPVSNRVRFRVHLDHLSHIVITATRGAERTETGLRGLTHLAADGWMVRPRSVHVDPLQRYLELDGQRFSSDAEGARLLESVLNEHYAPTASATGDVAVEVRENPGASTGFDIHFWMVRAGTRFEIKGHLSQDKLDILQDHEKCGLLQPGIILRISPPFLYFRRRRADGGEEAVPGIPDVKYRAIAAPELQRLLNHPLIRRTAGGPAAEETAGAGLPSDIAAARLTRHAGDHHHLWLELQRLGGTSLQRAFTHHNVGELVGAGLLREGVTLSLSPDNRQLHITAPADGIDERFSFDDTTGEETLQRASRALSAALKPAVAIAAAAAPAEPAVASVPLPELPPTPAPPPREVPVPPPPARSDSTPDAVASANQPTEPVRRTPPPPARPAAAEQPEDPVVAGLFEVTDPVRVNVEIFRQLADRLHLPPQDVLLSLPRVFEDREFEILAFGGEEIGSVLELRSGGFYGVYLSHLGPQRIDLVYACHGTHLEWGADKCSVQPTAGAETIELKGPALRGLAQNRDNHFVFIVEPRYRDFIAAHERACAEAFAHFLTIREWAARRADYPLIWPVAS